MIGFLNQQKQITTLEREKDKRELYFSQGWLSFLSNFVIYLNTEVQIQNHRAKLLSQIESLEKFVQI